MQRSLEEEIANQRLVITPEEAVREIPGQGMGRRGFLTGAVALAFTGCANGLSQTATIQAFPAKPKIDPELEDLVRTLEKYVMARTVRPNKAEADETYRELTLKYEFSGMDLIKEAMYLANKTLIPKRLFLLQFENFQKRTDKKRVSDMIKLFHIDSGDTFQGFPFNSKNDASRYRPERYFLGDEIFSTYNSPPMNMNYGIGTVHEPRWVLAIARKYAQQLYSRLYSGYPNSVIDKRIEQISFHEWAHMEHSLAIGSSALGWHGEYISYLVETFYPLFTERALKFEETKINGPEDIVKRLRTMELTYSRDKDLLFEYFWNASYRGYRGIGGDNLPAIKNITEGNTQEGLESLPGLSAKVNQLSQGEYPSDPRSRRASNEQKELLALGLYQAFLRKNPQYTPRSAVVGRDIKA